MNKLEQTNERMIEMNEALVLGAVRQHQLTEAADLANSLLRAEVKERKLVEEALRRAQTQLMDRAGQLQGLVAERTTELTATNKQLETFVYSIAHDLRAPLRSMQGISAMLVREAGQTLTDTGKAYADRINKAAQFMDAMLIALLDFSRLSQQEVVLTPIKLETVMESLPSTFQKEIEEKNARLQIVGPWPSVLAHGATLTQVVRNLVSNALKFTSEDRPPLLQLWSEERGKYVRVWVEDNGPGIAPRHQGEIFKVFTRLDGEKFPGTGIGLAIVWKGLERMGGGAGVESVVGQGSRFWFELQKAP